MSNQVLWMVGDNTDVACLAQRVWVLDHLLEHWICDVAQLERGRLLRYCLPIEDMGVPIFSPISRAPFLKYELSERTNLRSASFSCMRSCSF